jgi:hypothetical protein
MGTLVTSELRTDTKPNYVIDASITPAAIAVVATELAAWVGNTFSCRVEMTDGLEVCKDKFRESGWPDPTPTFFNTVSVDTKTGAVTIVLSGAHPTLTEDDVAVIQGTGYAPDGFSNSAQVTRMSELFLEYGKGNLLRAASI